MSGERERERVDGRWGKGGKDNERRVKWNEHVVAAFLECWVLALTMKHRPGIGEIKSDLSLRGEKKRGNAGKRSCAVNARAPFSPLYKGS